jgi:ATP synthase mitochondrial F1 complex assembly factor 1
MDVPKSDWHPSPHTSIHQTPKNRQGRITLRNTKNNYKTEPKRSPPLRQISNSHREGISSVSELRERYQTKIRGVKKKMDSVPAKIGFRKPPPRAQPSATAKTPVKTLASYVDVDKLRKHTDTREIELIWRAGHTKDTLICAVIPTAIYERIKSVAHDHPMFILPLARDGGIEMHFMQFKFAEANVTHLLFTSLLEYKTHGEFARPHTTVMHFEDLSEDKGIVLMRGEVDAEQKRVVGLDEARSLVMHVQKLYGADPESERGKIRRGLIDAFSRGSTDFDVTRLMDELNRID